MFNLKLGKEKIEIIVGISLLIFLYIGIPYIIALISSSLVYVSTGYPEFNIYVNQIKFKTAVISAYLSPIVFGLLSFSIYLVIKNMKQWKDK